jgi:thermopsin
MNARPRTLVLVVAVAAVMIVSSLGLIGGAASPLATSTGARPAAAASGTGARDSTSVPAGAASLTAASPGIAAPPIPAAATGSGSAATTQGSQTLSDLESRGISPHDIYLPDFSGEVHSPPASGHISPTYTTSPAPFGIGEFGLENLSGTVTPYTLSTSSLNASFSTSGVSGLSADISGPDEYGVQLNAVLNNVTIVGSQGYQFWTQNVFFYSPALDALEFVSNVWNFSGEALSCNALYAYGGYNECPEYYYGNSSFIPVSYPFSVNLYLNSSLIDGRDAVFFNYSLSDNFFTQSGSFDYVIFNSLAPGGNPASTPVPMYVANGFAYNPIGLPDDFEIMIGGPGGGSNFDMTFSASTYMTLQYWNATAGSYENVPSAYNVGGDTGETSIGVNDAWAQFPGCADCAELSAGPSFQYGLWNASAGPLETVWVDQDYVLITTHTMDSFLFLAQGDVWNGWDGTNWSLFQWSSANWAPDGLYLDQGISLPDGVYTAVILQANYDPVEFTFDSTGCYPCTANIPMTMDNTTGVYTPLWAMNETAVAYISTGFDAYMDYLLMGNQYAPIGTIMPFSDFGPVSFPWFGAVNDYFFPVFMGLWLNDVGYVDYITPPSFETAFPSWDAGLVDYFGVPTTNDLQMLVNDSTEVNFIGGTIGGWWFYDSYFGPDQSVGQLTYWNSTYSVVTGITFETGGMGLFLYGGSYNTVYGDSFYTSIPVSPDPYATTAAYWGATGLVDADYGDASVGGVTLGGDCSYCDIIVNNIFDTFVTATQLPFDPYTGGAPLDPMSEAWNVTYTPGFTNIVGGDYLGGNYWWDYGTYWNPYNVLPDVEYNPLVPLEFGLPAAICTTEVYVCDNGGGDFVPLTIAPLYNITFEETGLPSSTGWGAAVYVPYTGSSPDVNELWSGWVSNATAAPGSVNITETAGTWSYAPFSDNPAYAALDGTVTLVNGSVVVVIAFSNAYSVTVSESGLPSGTAWTLTVTGGPNANESTATGTGTSLAIDGLLPGSYTITATTAAPYATTRASVAVTIASADVSVSVTFVAVESLSVHGTGLPSGTSFTFSYANASSGYSGTVVSTDGWVNVTLPPLDFAWSAWAAGYVAIPSSGSVTLSGAATLTVAFAPQSATGTLSGTVTPSSGTLWIDGATVALGSGGSFSVTLPIGIHSVEVTASGYAPYFNNVTVSSGGTTSLAIALRSTSGPSATGIGSLGWVLVALLGALAAIFLVTTLIFARRGRQPPPPPTPYSTGAPPVGSATPPPSAPAWQEPPPPGSS